MRALLQRVTEGRAVMAADGEVVGEIGPGIVVLICAMPGDGDDEPRFLARKIANLRIFDDTDGKMNLSVQDAGGEVLAVSQFTLAAAWRKGNRPGFSGAAPPETAEEVYGVFVDALKAEGVSVATGRFRSHMRIELANDGPVTIWMDTDER